jgi:hypothetical protein
MRFSMSPVAAASCLAACCLSLSAHAASPLFEGSASLTGLSFQLIDLDPNDGITPSVTFKTDQGLIFATGLRRMVDMDNQEPNASKLALTAGSWLLPSSPVSVISTDGLSTASASADGLSSSVRVGLADVQNLPAAAAGSSQSSLEVWGSTSAGTSVQLPFSTTDAVTGVTTVGAMPDTGYATFKLSAHTAIVFSGHARASISVDVGSLPWDLSSGGGQTPGFLTASSGIGGGFAAPQTPLQPEYAQDDEFMAAVESALMFQSDAVYAQWDSFSNLPQAMNEGDVSFTLKNLQGSTQDGVVLLTTDTLLTVTTPAAVPELSTAAQSLLGFGGLLALMRRRVR